MPATRDWSRWTSPKSTACRRSGWLAIRSQEVQKTAEQRVVNFAACSAVEQHLAAGADDVADLVSLAELKGARQGLRHGDRVAVSQCGFDVEAGRRGAHLTCPPLRVQLS